MGEDEPGRWTVTIQGVDIIVTVWASDEEEAEEAVNRSLADAVLPVGDLLIMGLERARVRVRRDE